MASPSTSPQMANASLPSDNISITVNINGDKSVPLNVQPQHTITNLLEFLTAASIPVTAGSKLLLAGKTLEPSTTVGELQLDASSKINLFTPPSPHNTPEAEASSSTATEAAPKVVKKKSNKPRCQKSDCKALAQPIVGECGFCDKKFCGKHRMLESHNCEGLSEAARQDKDRNAKKLEGERTVMLRGL